MTASSPSPQVAVRGEARLTADPEVADLHVDVRVHGRDRQTVLERCRARQDDVTAVLAAAGDAVGTVETTGLAVYPEDRHGGPGAAASLATRVVVVRLDAVGDLVVALGRLDDVAVSGPHWRLRPDSPVVTEARVAAVRDAVRRAQQYARALGAQLTAVVEVSDVGLSGPGPRVAAPAMAMARFEAGELHLDLEPARQEVHGAVEVRFAMSDVDREVFRA